MNRNSVRLIGLLLLVPSVFLALMPLLAEHTVMLSGMPHFTWMVGDLLIAQYTEDLNGAAIAQTWWGVWIVAVFAEILLLGVSIFRPIQRNRFKINIRG